MKLMGHCCHDFVTTAGLYVLIEPYLAINRDSMNNNNSGWRIEIHNLSVTECLMENSTPQVVKKHDYNNGTHGG